MTTFRIATPSDDATVHALLRETAMLSRRAGVSPAGGAPSRRRGGEDAAVPAGVDAGATWADIAIERDSSSYDWAVIAEEDDDVIGVYTASVLPAHVDGLPTRLGYLGGLRVKPEHRRRIRYLRDGYASVPRLARERVPWWFTTIGAENVVARRLLEAGVRGLPRYHFRGEYVTYALPVARGRRRGIWQKGVDVALHNRLAARFQCSPVLDDDAAGDFFVCDGGVAALWDQRAFKRVVARRYRTPSLIPMYNAYAKLFRRVPLPREGQALDHTFIAYFAMESPSVAAIEDLLWHCATPVATIGMHAENPLREIIETFKPLSTRSRVYAVSFDGTPLPNGRPFQPEAALL